MSIWTYIRKERHEIATNAVIAIVGFFLAFIGNSYVDDWKERRVVAAALLAIKAEARSNELAYRESFAQLFRDGLVLREFSLVSVTQALSNPSFTKHARPDQVQVLGAYMRELTLANAYRAKSEAIRFSADYFIDSKKPTLKTWEAGLIQSWENNLEKCQLAISRVVALE